MEGRGKELVCFTGVREELALISLTFFVGYL